MLSFRLKIRLSIIFSATFTSLAVPGWTQSVIVDTQSDTTANVDAAGHITIDIAPVDDDRISHNRFTRFNVPEAGLDFDNRSAGARTIISEVTGSERSLIEGQVEILGQRAHLFIANPNGILVDGGRFINTGGLVLSTGEIGFVERVPAPFRTQINTTLNVTQGEIIVAEGGLSGAMDTLHFLSKSLRIDGPVTNENSSPFAGIELTAGDSDTEFDSSLLPLNDLSRWSTVTAPEEDEDAPDKTEAYLINITETGALTGSQITALVTDSGAGVRHAGRILADRNTFSLTADGKILIDGGETIAAGAIDVSGREIEMTGRITAAQFGSSEPNDAETNDRNIFDFDDTSAVLIVAELEDFDDAPQIDPSNLPEDIDNLRTDFRAIFNSAGGGVTLTATEGPISAQAALVSAAGDVVITTDEEFSGAAIETFSGGAINISASEVSISSHPILDGTEIGGLGRSFFAANSPLTITASEGDIAIDGARLQGGTGIVPETDEDSDEAQTGTSSGEEEAEDDIIVPSAIILTAANNILISSIDADNLGVVFGIDGDVQLSAEGDVINHTSRIVANGDIVIDAGGAFENIISVPDGTAEPTANYRARSRIFGRRTSRHLTISYGDLEIPDQLAFVTATGSVDVTAEGDILNVGGQINANDGDVNLSAQNIISEGLVSGEFEYQRSCFILCRSSGTSTLNVTGGQISAGGELVLTSENQIINRGGFFTGLEGITLSGHDIIFESLFLPQLVDRPGGLYNFWSGHSAWLYWRDTLGGAFAGEANITVNDAEKIRLRGVEIENLIADIEAITEYKPRQIGDASTQTIGYFSDLNPIIGK